MIKKKPARSAVPFERIVLGTTYAITVNPSKECGARINQYNTEFYKGLFDVIGSKNRCVLFPEFSSIARLHYHGVIEINCLYDYIHLLQYLNMCSTYEIDTISDEQVWFDYCIKQDAYTDILFVHYPLTNINYDGRVVVPFNEENKNIIAYFK